MKVLIQRSGHSSVSINNELYNAIDKGLVVFVCFTDGDTVKDIDYMVHKILALRIFDDENGVMNKSIVDINGSILSISQFTLYANTKGGNRPSYINAMNGTQAIKLYEEFNTKLGAVIPCKTGVFGADMIVSITNDGPVTIIIDTKEVN